MKLFGIVAAFVAIPGWAACVFHCESPDCAWNTVAPPACTQAEPFGKPENLQTFADRFVAERKPLDQAIARLRALHFNCNPDVRNPGEWNCVRVLKVDDRCAEDATLILAPKAFGAERAADDAAKPLVRDIHATLHTGCFGVD